MAIAKIYTPPDNKTNFLFFPRLNKKVIVKNNTEIAQGLMLSIKAEIMIAGKPHKVKAGEFIIMPANKPHALKAVKKFKMALVMIRS